jgi:hypothetical protein
VSDRGPINFQRGPRAACTDEPKLRARPRRMPARRIPLPQQGIQSPPRAPRCLQPTSPCSSSYARERMLLTDVTCHCPPRAVATPRAFSAAAISLKVAAPAFCAPRMMASTLAANLSASAVTASSAPLRATESLGLPRVTREPLQPQALGGSGSRLARAPSRRGRQTDGARTGPRLAPTPRPKRAPYEPSSR